MGPIYKVVHAPGDAPEVIPSERARACIQKVLASLEERRSFFHRPTKWVLPEAEIVNMMPNSDASKTVGFGAVMLVGETLQYFHGKWPKPILEGDLGIAILEAWAILMVATTWGKLFTGTKTIFRTDSAHACGCLNRLSGKSPAMELMCDLWEDVQFEHGFEGLVVHCDGKRNRAADITSRVEADRIPAALAEELGRLEMNGVTCQRVPVQWGVGELRIDVESQLLNLR